MKQKDQLKMLKKELKYNSISLKKFLIIYCGVCAKTLVNLKLTHKEVKDLIPELKCLSFEELLKDTKNLYIGNVIAVRDSYGNIAPYISPKVSTIEVSKTCDSIEDEEEDKEICISISDDLNLYDLSCLCKTFRISKNFKQYRKAYRILKSKKECKIKKYNRQKYNLELKEEDYEY